MAQIRIQKSNRNSFIPQLAQRNDEKRKLLDLSRAPDFLTLKTIDSEVTSSYYNSVGKKAGLRPSPVNKITAMVPTPTSTI